MRSSPYELEFYADGSGRKPVLEWIRDLSREQRRIAGIAMRDILQQRGLDVCGTPFGRHLGQGLFEFRLREDDFLLRVFCHAYGDKIILLLGSYDKSEDPSRRRQDAEIETARRRLTDWRQGQ